jgi:peptidoglycan/LPS O-acetylase OafA/YrhL
MSAYFAPKPHFAILNGLRGVAAIAVICFHILEAHWGSPFNRVINHGYLAVDFFFILSGFVVGYTYDDRWGVLNTIGFIKRRLIRLHPMLVMGTLLGAALFIARWQTGRATPGAFLLAILLGLLMIPSTRGMDIRGWGEMYPLNGPSWSLFFEYIGNLRYAFVIRRLSTLPLAALTFVVACYLAVFALQMGDLNYGWRPSDIQFAGGILRLVFAFSAGALLSRVFKPSFNMKGAFWICGVVLVALISVPRIGGREHMWMNGLYETLCCVGFFPLLLYLGASEKTVGKLTTKICKFLGDISYPLYIVHYQFIYLYFAWARNNKGLPLYQYLIAGAAVVAGSMVVAWLCLKLYEMPVRNYLTKWIFKKKGEGA